MGKKGKEMTYQCAAQQALEKSVVKTQFIEFVRISHFNFNSGTDVNVCFAVAPNQKDFCFKC